jgi:phosphopantetheinyl transferase
MFVWIVNASNCGLPFPVRADSQAFSHITKHFSIQGSECERLACKFSKELNLSLLGRVLLRAQIRQFSGVDLSSIVLRRTPYGKPYWIPPDGYTTDPYYNLEFNVSHHGDCTVVVADRGANTNALGCDVAVMRVSPVSSTVQQYCYLMRNIFSTRELTELRQHVASPSEQLFVFFRFWTLKESFLKGLGVGITHPQWPLSRLEFTLLEDGRATLHVLRLGDEYDDFPTDEWEFVTTTIDNKHVLSVARQIMPGSQAGFRLVMNRITNVLHLHESVSELPLVYRLPAC